MKGSSVGLTIKLEAATRQEGRIWLAWCVPIDVMTQAETKHGALKALREAVELWFDSCMDRGVLEQALLEAGFCKAKRGEMLPTDASTVEVRESKPRFSAKREYIEVSIPAYIAAQCNSDHLRAPR